MTATAARQRTTPAAADDPRLTRRLGLTWGPVTNGWADFAYNVAFDQAGRVWDGRGIDRRSAGNGGPGPNLDNVGTRYDSADDLTEVLFTKEEIEADRKRMNLLREKAKESQAGPAGAVVTMRNDLDHRVGLHPDGLVQFDPEASDGARVGRNPDTTVAPNGSASARATSGLVSTT